MLLSGGHQPEEMNHELIHYSFTRTHSLFILYCWDTRVVQLKKKVKLQMDSREKLNESAKPLILNIYIYFSQKREKFVQRYSFGI